MSRVYTRKGDDGTTSLAGGTRVSKTHPRIAAYGKADELISWIGVVKSYLALPECTGLSWLNEPLILIQSRLMTIAGVLATEVPDPKWATTLAEATTHLEASIDQIQLHIPAFKSFILPGSPSVSAFTHVARTVCRETERLVAALGTDIVFPEVIIYLNRLSDYLFVLARYMCTNTGNKEDFFL